MIIAVYGAGYVGLVSAACFAKLGHHVICADVDSRRVAMLLNGECPIHEEGLPILLREQLTLGRLSFTDNLLDTIKAANIHFIATGTPSLADGRADLSQVFAVTSLIALHAEMSGVIVIKSTVSVGSGDTIALLIEKEMAHSKKTITLDVASNPEFLREGSAISDFLKADRIVVGGSPSAIETIKSLYQPIIEESVPFLAMSRRSAELTKYAANAMLACKISFINQISQFAEEFDADIDEIRQAIGLDNRIGPLFLQAGIGYGGSCFPKDVRALVQIAKSKGIDARFLEAIDNVNNQQKNWIYTQIFKHFKQNICGLKIGFWGLSFKPGTDDMREASSLVAINSLLQTGVEIFAFDPVAVEAAQCLFSKTSTITWCDSAEAIFNASLDALVIATEWPCFKNYSLQNLQQKLQGAAVFDGRNCFELSAVKKAGISPYYSVGRPVVVGDEYANNAS